MKTIFDQITDNLRQIIKKAKDELAERDKVIKILQDEVDRLEKQNHRLRQELEHKAFQDDF